MKRIAPAHAEQELTQLAAQFDHWRHHRVTRRERIPQSLWEQAVLLPYETFIRYVCTATRICL